MTKFSKAFSLPMQDAIGRAMWAMGIPSLTLPEEAHKAFSDSFYGLPHDERTSEHSILSGIQLASMALKAVSSMECLATIAKSPKLQDALAAASLQVKGLQPSS